MTGMTEITKTDIKRQHILDTGRALVLRHGFGGVGLSRLLSACNIPKGSFYHYFKSKDAFGQALLEEYVKSYLTRFDDMTAGGQDAHSQLTAFWAAWLETTDTGGIANQCLVVKLGAEVADLSEPMRVILNNGIVTFVNRIATLLRQGAGEGSLPQFEDATATAQMLYAKWLGAAILAKLDCSQIPLEQALQDTNRLLSINKI